MENVKPKVKKSGILLKQIASFIVCLMLMLVVPIWRDHKIIGLSLPQSDAEEKVETMTLEDGKVVINTTEIGKDIIGYVGPTPVEITIADDRILKIKPLPNQETPEFFGAVRNSDLLESLDGMTLEEAQKAHIDAVSGATFTSNAIIGSIRAGVNYAINENAGSFKSAPEKLPVKFYFILAVILAAAILPFFLKGKVYRIIQLALNVGILGFWGGTFISYSIMTSFLTNGITSVLLIPVALMLVAAFIYPFFGKRNYYCAWMCPYGSIQELLGKCISFKFRMSPTLLKWLTYFREALWVVLMWLLITGLFFDWMGYEPFAAFFFGDASLAVLIIAGVFLLLSLFIQRPYCRFVCPTGSLFKYAEGSY